MRRHILALIILLVLAIFSGCAREASPGYQNLRPGDLLEIMQNDKNYLLVDVREPQELIETGFIPGALNIPAGQVEKSLDRLPKTGKLIIYCRSGQRSAQAARLLAEKGFTNVYNLEGGITAWPYEKKK